jgi:hypothetical protein
MPNPTPDTADADKSSERLPAVWPWLLIPLVALALYFALSKVRSVQAAGAAGGATPAVSSPDDGSSGNVR